jgi:hypothetical protein
MKTYGFDYAFALSIDAVNAILRRNLAGVAMSVHYTTLDEDTGSTITLSGKLAPWQIVRGGQNTLLNVNVPFGEGSLTRTGGALKGNYDLSGVTVELQLSLGWMGAGDAQQGSGSGAAASSCSIPRTRKTRTTPATSQRSRYSTTRNISTLWRKGSSRATWPMRWCPTATRCATFSPM